MYERLTHGARKALILANQEAQRYDHPYKETEHLLLGLLRDEFGGAACVLKNLGIDLVNTRLEIEKCVPRGTGFVSGRVPMAHRTKQAIEYAMREATRLNHDVVGTEHLLLGLLSEEEGVAARVLVNSGSKLENIRTELQRLLSSAAP